MNQRNPAISKGIDWSLAWIYLLLVAIGLTAIFAATYQEGDPVIQSFLRFRTDYSKQFYFFIAASVLALFILLIPDAELSAYSPELSTLIGAALVILGAAAIAAGTLEYRRYCKTLRPEDLPSPHATRLPQILAWSIVVLAGALLFVLLA